MAAHPAAHPHSFTAQVHLLDSPLAGFVPGSAAERLILQPAVDCSMDALGCIAPPGHRCVIATKGYRPHLHVMAVKCHVSKCHSVEHTGISRK